MEVLEMFERLMTPDEKTNIWFLTSVFDKFLFRLASRKTRITSRLIYTTGRRQNDR